MSNPHQAMAPRRPGSRARIKSIAVRGRKVSILKVRVWIVAPLESSTVTVPLCCASTLPLFEMCVISCWKPRWPPVLTPPIVNAK